MINAAKKLYAKGKAAVTGAIDKAKAKILGGDDTPEGKQKRLDKGMRAAKAAGDRFAGRVTSKAVLTPLMSAIRLRYGLTSLELIEKGDRWGVGAVNPTAKETLEAKLSVYSEADIQKLVIQARAEAMSADASGLALTLSFKEKGQFSRARDVQKRKTVAHGGGVEALSGWA